MRWLSVCAMMMATLAAAEMYVPSLDFDASDSFFLPGENHSVTEVKEAARAGWYEHVDSVGFGAYGMTVTQRINPETEMPEADKRRWGDSFVGIIGKKPAVYMASNWSPWSFLSAEITLDGGETLPSPTLIGRLVFAGLREVTSGRITADFIWRDTAGGYLRAHCVGWRGVDAFGLQLRYWPPPGRTVENLTWALTAHPYDYSDRGQWERRRWVSTPTRDEPLADEALDLDLATEWQAVLHNRFGQTDSGVKLALDRQTVTGAALLTEGDYVRLRLSPACADAPIALVLGDWVGEPYDRARAQWFAQEDALGERITATRELQAEQSRSAVEEFLRVAQDGREREEAGRQRAAAWVTEKQW